MSSSAIFGTIELSAATRLLAGTKHAPITVLEDGKPPKALARLYLVQYTASEAGRYNELIFLVDAVSEGVSQRAKSFEWVNPFSGLLPAFDPLVTPFIHQLILSKEADKAIAYGRELLGMDKRAGVIELVKTRTGTRFSVEDEHGARVFRGAFHPDKSLSSRMRTIGKLTSAALGKRFNPWNLELTLHPRMLSKLIEVSALTFSRDPNGGGLVTHRATNRWLPSIYEAMPKTLDFEIDGSSALGKLLKDADFTPTTFALAESSALMVEVVPRS